MRVFRIRTTREDLRTGTITMRVLPRSWKTLRGAERHAQTHCNWVWAPPPDYKPVERMRAFIFESGEAK
jgi:hypothetical protein